MGGEQRGRITSTELLAIPLLMQSRILLAFLRFRKLVLGSQSCCLPDKSYISGNLWLLQSAYLVILGQLTFIQLPKGYVGILGKIIGLELSHKSRSHLTDKCFHHPLHSCLVLFSPFCKFSKMLNESDSSWVCLSGKWHECEVLNCFVQQENCIPLHSSPKQATVKLTLNCPYFGRSGQKGSWMLQLLLLFWNCTHDINLFSHKSFLYLGLLSILQGAHSAFFPKG